METFSFKNTGISADRAVLLAIDDVSLPFRSDVCYFPQKPKVRQEPILKASPQPNQPDSQGAYLYGTVLFEEGKYRMWYAGIDFGFNPDMGEENWKELTTVVSPNDELRDLMISVCYAESTDGINWVKPNLGQVLYKGSTNNNALAFPDPMAHKPTVLRDDEDPDPSRRYKMVYFQYGFNDNKPGCASRIMRTATSPDGLHWTSGERGKIYDYIEQCSFYKYNSYYIVNGQTMSRMGPESAFDRGRVGYVWISPDFENWIQESAESFALPDLPSGRDGTFDQVHLGVAPIVYPNVAVGLYGLWHNDMHPFLNISCDFGLVVSNDGILFREPIKEHVYLAAEESAAEPVEGKSLKTILCQANAILNIGEETVIFHGRWRNGWTFKEDEMGPITNDDSSEIAVATLPRDRWAAVGVINQREKGSLWSAPVTLPNSDLELSLNADGSEGIEVEISDEKFRLLPEFSGANAGRAAQDGLESAVSWTKGSFSTLAGQTVRIRVVLKKSNAVSPRFYGLTLSQKGAGK